ncbi:hypothetical protein PENTCL1PPCAC_6842, partial [Pristionchus entomophagus]
FFKTSAAILAAIFDIAGKNSCLVDSSRLLLQSSRHLRHSREKLLFEMRITLTEAEKRRLIEKEKKERRVARLVQVRSQAREAAQSILSEVRTQKEVKVAELSARIQCEMRNELMKSAKTMRREETVRRKDGGKEEENGRKISRGSHSVDPSKHVERGMEALKRLKEERKQKQLEKMNTIKRMEKAKKEAIKISAPAK